MTRTEKNRQESKASLKVKHKLERIFESSNSLLFRVLKLIQFYLHRISCAGVEHAAKHFTVKFCQISQGTKSLLT